MNLAADAWRKVTKKTIVDSWAKAGILSDNDSDISDNETIINDDDDNIGELQLLINELPITDPISIEEYINIDDEILAEEELSLEEIVNIVKGQSAVEDEMEEEHEIITTSDSLNSIEKLIKYVRQNINSLDMQNLVNLKKKIISDSKKKQKQGRLEDFFNFSCF
ncbi:hypothetical protein C1646_748097 [Rhizophagus diaphanus]|nr:hypothetical protein C1646_748097 [Rhizophagus diaphanus] [Rhizophagus sp. MUCL 43196]